MLPASTAMFYNRRREIKRIQAALAQPEGQFIVLYGRRRCGKSTLLTNKILGSGDIYLLAPEINQELQRRELVRALAPHFPGIDLVSFSDWDRLFDYVVRNTRQRFTLVLDEFPHLVRAAPELPSILNRYLDRRAERAFDLIVCGSSQQMMRGIVLDSTAPLYGRADEILKIEPLAAGWLLDHMPGLNPTELITEFAIWGGVPRYWELRARFPSLAEAVSELVLSPTGTLREEPTRLLLDELTDVAQSLGLLTVVAGGAHRLTEIAARMQRPAGDLSRPLKRLIEMGYLGKEIPYGTSPRKTRQTLYTVADPFIRFYYDLCFSLLTRIVPGQESTAYAIIAERLPGFVGRTWEDLCRRAVIELPEFSGQFLLPQRWWGTGTQRRRLEIDFVAESTDGSCLLLGEYKWSDLSTADRLHAELVIKARELPFYRGQEIVSVVAARSVTDSTAGIVLTPERVLNALRQ